ncbi:DUF4232 domain-containing protein [Streptomyces sp. DH1]|uniref:DUF4232 domain-containing protein n=1 Tax=Streptomyces sp. DH1 TaxID=2857012 RepID=UPI001E2A2C66|nr:DUF4232 domain-containing protein [Streptomyces sp. DH1]
MSTRTARRTRLFAATTVALAALSLTACESGDGSDTGAAAPSSSAPASGSSEQPPAGGKESGNATEANGSKGTNGSAGASGAKDSSGADSSGSGSSGSSGSAGKSTGGTDDDSDLPGKCSATDVKITATKVSRPLNHLLLTATNTGSKTCMLPPYPAARFGEAQSVPPVAQATKPQSLTGVEPGKSGYAGVLLSSGDGSGENGYEAKTLTIPFEDGSIATVTLPAGGVYVDTALTVTYWQTDMDAALAH